MRQEASQLPKSTPLDYAPRVDRRKRSFQGFLPVTMALVTVGWLGYVQFARPRYHQGGPLWEVLWEWSLLPGAITVLLAIPGLRRQRRNRWASVAAIAIVLVAYVLLSPPNNFA
jgi:hypothetical protein